MDRRFADRREAGKLLASELKAYQDCPGAMVLALAERRGSCGL